MSGLNTYTLPLQCPLLIIIVLLGFSHSVDVENIADVSEILLHQIKREEGGG
jgi:hypothetical protein